MPHEHTIEVEGEFAGEAGHRPGRLIAVATVVTTLAAAGVGYMQASALRTHDEADARAERIGALALNVAAANEDQALIQVDRYRVVREDQMQAKRLASQARRTGDATTLVQSIGWDAAATLTAQSSRAIAGEQQIEIDCSAATGRCGRRGLPVICSPGTRGCGTGAWYSTARDPAFPTRYEQAARWESYRLSAQREAADHEADAAEARFAHLAAALTMLAVAVFLFGYSLTPQGRERRKLFLKFGALFVLFGCGWALTHEFQGLQAPKSGNATAFANGEVALNDGDYGTAVRELRRATELWPGDANAFSELAQAQYELTQGSSGTTIVPSVNTLNAAVADDRKALAAGSESPTTISDLGSNLLFLGVLTGNDGAVAEAKDLSARGAEEFVHEVKDGGHPGTYLVSARFTVAEADLALGAPTAREEYCRAISQMVDLRHEVAPNGVDAAAHEDVNLILAHRPRRAAEAHAILHEIDAAAAGKSTSCAPATRNQQSVRRKSAAKPA
jgi:tetratricopeptide (TPR) repeat protein